MVLADGAGAVREACEAVPDGGRWVGIAQTDVAASTAVELRVAANDRPGGGVATVTVPA